MARSAQALACAVLLLSSGAAFGQENRLTIQQDGTSNTLTVDQTNATGSRVGGVSVSGPVSQNFVQVIETEIPGVAADPATGTGAMPPLRRLETRSVTLDVLSGTARPEEAARQIGRGNSADVQIDGTGGYVGLLQNSLGDPLGRGNTANVQLSGSGEALLGQIGNGNSASIDVASGAIGGTVLQRGDGNTADLSVTGLGAQGSISQFGSGLNSGLSVEGAGTNASLIANGAGSATVTNGVAVISNGATVTITQTAFGGGTQ